MWPLPVRKQSVAFPDQDAQTLSGTLGDPELAPALPPFPPGRAFLVETRASLVEQF